MSILLDAGPCLNFLAVGQQNVLIQVAEHHQLKLLAPKRVNAEVLGMAKDARFARTGVAGTWTTLITAGRVTVLDDSLTTERLTNAVTRISGLPAPERVRSSRSLGEIMVLAHASVYAQDGLEVFVLFDDGTAAAVPARNETGWRLRAHPGR